MQRSITQLIVGMAIAAAMAVAGVSVIARAAALTSAAERARAHAPDSRRVSPPGETGARMGDRETLRRILLDESHYRIR